MVHFSTPTIDQSARAKLTERRYVYNGEATQQVRDFMPRGNRIVKRRKRSPFTIIVILFVISLLIVFYVWNKITVNRLAVEVNDLQNQYQRITGANEILRAEINKKSNLERIGKIATERLNLTYPKEQPIWFTVDNNRLDHIENR